eukprot:5584947-Amphidinium_carterae.1
MEKPPTAHTHMFLFLVGCKFASVESAQRLSLVLNFCPESHHIWVPCQHASKCGRWQLCFATLHLIPAHMPWTISVGKVEQQTCSPKCNSSTCTDLLQHCCAD